MSTRPRPMTVRTRGSNTPLLDALVVTLSDGRLGFSTTGAAVSSLTDGAPVKLTDSRSTPLIVTGPVTVVRSGTAYEEVRGRTRQAEGWLGRWRRRGDDAVVLVDLS